MNRAAFLALMPFKYTGHFNRLKRYPLVYCKTGTWAQQMSVYDAMDKTWWPVIECTDDGFTLFTRGFGRINIRCSECKLIEPG